MRYLTRFILALTLMGCQVTVSPNPLPSPNPTTTPGPGITPSTLSMTSSRIQSFGTRVLNNQAAWESFWREHTGSDADRPSVNFETQTVLAVLLGERLTGGYAVEITEVQRTGSQLTVRYHEIEPPVDVPVIQVVTYPSHVVAIPYSHQKGDFSTVDFVKEN